jgi:hypothetical protein
VIGLRYRTLLVEAYRAWETRDWSTAAVRLAEVARRHPEHRDAGVWWFDAALAYKFLRDWPNAYELGKLAAARAEHGAEDPAFWNLGIAATALGDWTTARESWAAYGIRLQPGHGEINENLGITPIRLNPGGAGEVVWARRLCPARARVLSVPTTDSGRRYGEIVLHDGEPTGERELEGRRYPVFDEIMLWQPSELPTLTVEVAAARPDDVSALIAIFEEWEYGAEPWSAFRMICGCCSETSITQVVDHQVAGRQRVSLAAPPQQAHELLNAWRAGDPHRRDWSDLLVVN